LFAALYSGGAEIWVDVAGPVRLLKYSTYYDAAFLDAFVPANGQVIGGI
jgi:hypothetical protein